MLLRRTIEHVKAQNWFAVGLDFVIVVFGVFVGLQVQDWNDSRKHQAERLQSWNAAASLHHMCTGDLPTNFRSLTRCSRPVASICCRMRA